MICPCWCCATATSFSDVGGLLLFFPKNLDIGLPIPAAILETITKTTHYLTQEMSSAPYRVSSAYPRGCITLCGVPGLHKDYKGRCKDKYGDDGYLYVKRKEHDGFTATCEYCISNDKWLTGNPPIDPKDRVWTA